MLSETYANEFDKIIDKACLCEDLAAPALIKYGIENNRPLKSTGMRRAKILHITTKLYHLKK